MKIKKILKELFLYLFIILLTFFLLNLLSSFYLIYEESVTKIDPNITNAIKQNDEATTADDFNSKKARLDIIELRKKSVFYTSNNDSFIALAPSTLKKYTKSSTETFNINEDGTRFSFESKNNFKNAKKIALFGGSTILGYGVDDNSTISSWINKISDGKYISTNYGQESSSSSDELNNLMYEFINNKNFKKFNTIIFYDGVNDLSVCEFSKQTFPYAKIEKNYWKPSESNVYSILSNIFLNDIVKLFRIKFIYHNSGDQSHKVLNSAVKFANINQMNCQDNPDRAEKVADLIVKRWLIANQIAKINGSKFLAILQPAPYYSNPDLSHLNLNQKELKNNYFTKRYNSVYPLIIKKTKKYDWFIDMTKTLNNIPNIYIDSCCHVNSEGNKIIAKNIIHHLD